ncbi:hypothetical protein pb186bvf_001549 [Paramecium bursaria]
MLIIRYIILIHPLKLLLLNLMLLITKTYDIQSQNNCQVNEVYSFVYMNSAIQIINNYFNFYRIHKFKNGEDIQLSLQQIRKKIYKNIKLILN